MKDCGLTDTDCAMNWFLTNKERTLKNWSDFQNEHPKVGYNTFRRAFHKVFPDVIVMEKPNKKYTEKLIKATEKRVYEDCYVQFNKLTTKQFIEWITDKIKEQKQASSQTPV